MAIAAIIYFLNRRLSFFRLGCDLCFTYLAVHVDRDLGMYAFINDRLFLAKQPLVAELSLNIASISSWSSLLDLSQCLVLHSLVLLLTRYSSFYCLRELKFASYPWAPFLDVGICRLALHCLSSEILTRCAVCWIDWELLELIALDWLDWLDWKMEIGLELLSG